MSTLPSALTPIDSLTPSCSPNWAPPQSIKHVAGFGYPPFRAVISDAATAARKDQLSHYGRPLAANLTA